MVVYGCMAAPPNFTLWFGATPPAEACLAPQGSPHWERGWAWSPGDSFSSRWVGVAEHSLLPAPHLAN